MARERYLLDVGEDTIHTFAGAYAEGEVEELVAL